MIRSFRAIVWLRWRLLLNSVKGTRRRDSMEQVSRAFAAIMPVAFVALSLGTVAAVCVLGFLGGRAISTDQVPPEVIVLIVRISLAVILALLLVVTVASPVQTTLTKYSRLLILPIPRQTLHLTEVFANLFDPWIAFMIPGLGCFAAGLAIGGQHRTALLALVAGAGIMAVLATTGSLISFLVGWLLRSRRRGELFTLVFVLCLSLLSFIPAALSNHLDANRSDAADQPARPPAATVEEFDRSLPGWTRVVPSELFGRAVLASVDGRPRAAWGAMAGLGLEGVVLFALSSAAHRKLIESIESDTRRRRSSSARASSWRVPLAGPAVSAIAITEYRTALRSVRGRLAVLLPGPMVALIMMLLRGMPSERGTWATAVGSDGYLVLAAGLVFALYALQPFTMNLFGTDRSGVTRLFLVPATDVELARGKIAGCGLILATAGILTLVIAALVAPTGPLVYWPAVILGAMSTFALLSPIAVWLSALFPVPADLSKTGTGGNPHPLPMFAGTVIVIALALPAAGVFLVNWLWIRQPGAVLLMMIAWFAVSIVIAVPFVGLASRAIGRRRENLALVAQGR